jgi:RNA polymerase sigma-70 factor (ECF subfamily)
VSHQGAELVGRMAGGDRQAFAAFYDGFAPLAYGLIRRILHDAPDADEVLQEVFLELWRAAGQYDATRGTPAAWVVTRARSRAIDRLRSLRKRDEVAVDRLDTMTAETPSGRPEDPGTEVVDRHLVQGALARLVPAQREVIELAYYGGMTQTEIAARLRQPLGTVKTRMRTALQHLRELLREPAEVPRA